MLKAEKLDPGRFWHLTKAATMQAKASDPSKVVLFA